MKQFSIFLRSPTGKVTRHFVDGKNAQTAQRLFLEHLKKHDLKKFATYDIVGLEEDGVRRAGGGGANLVASMPSYAAGGGGARAKKMSRLEELEAMLPKGYCVRTYSPGDGQTRYRFFDNCNHKQDYFGPKSGIFTALGYKDAWAFASGLRH